MRNTDRSELQKLLDNKKAVQEIVQSPEAKALAGMLAGQDQASLQHMAEKAAKGDTQELNALISSITSSPGGAELLRKLSGRLGK